MAVTGDANSRALRLGFGQGNKVELNQWLPPAPLDLPPFGRQRPTIEGIRPRVEGGRWPSKAAVGDRVVVEADILIDGHERVAGELRYAHQSDRQWNTVPMRDIGNDRWRAELPITKIGLYRFVIRARPDLFATWRRDMRARIEADQTVPTGLLDGALLVEGAAWRAEGADRDLLSSAAAALRHASACSTERANPFGAVLVADVPADLDEPLPVELVRAAIHSDEFRQRMERYPDPASSVTSEVQRLFADRERARFSTWYELFPRSASPDPGRAGTLRDVERRLPYLSRLGFDVLYLPPIHPIGVTNRKGRDGRTVAEPGEPGSPWAIGSADGGHRAIDPALGTLDDFRALVLSAETVGIDVALDLAFQASPDHPWVHERPEWFRRGPGGAIRHAENPPKRYEDIYPLDFECAQWPELWRELLWTARFWVEQGVRIFRVDNPHTKPFRFWEWFIASLKAEHPELIFLAEAFTRPKVMYQLAKLGFTQSYTYFAWRNEKWELEEYFTELTRTDVADYFRPNLWPNTPDILTEALQRGGTPAFVVRLILAATLGASYGIYGPAFELQEHVARLPGSEEYARSEKYEVRHWDLSSATSLADLIARVNSVRRAHPALQHDRSLRFHPVDNDHVIAYSKCETAGAEPDAVVVVVNLDPANVQSGWVDFDAAAVGQEGKSTLRMHDLLTEARYEWHPGANFVRLDPAAVPAHVFAVEDHPGREPRPPW
jgi:starch synthase (maltosyl-transferring)